MKPSKPLEIAKNSATNLEKPSPSFDNKARPSPGHVTARVRQFQERERAASELSSQSLQQPLVKTFAPATPSPLLFLTPGRHKQLEKQVDINKKANTEGTALVQPSLSAVSTVSPASASNQTHETQATPDTGLKQVQGISPDHSPVSILEVKTTLASPVEFLPEAADTADQREISNCSKIASFKHISPEEKSQASSEQKSAFDQQQQETSIESVINGNLKFEPGQSSNFLVIDSRYSTSTSKVVSESAENREQIQKECPPPGPTIISRSLDPEPLQLTSQTTLDNTPHCTVDDHLIQTLLLNQKCQATDLAPIPSSTEATKQEGSEQISNVRKTESKEPFPESSFTVTEEEKAQTGGESIIASAQQQTYTKGVISIPTDLIGVAGSSTTRISTPFVDDTTDVPRLRPLANKTRLAQGSVLAFDASCSGKGRRNTQQFHAPAFAQTNHAHEHRGRVVPPPPHRPVTPNTLVLSVPQINRPNTSQTLLSGRSLLKTPQVESTDFTNAVSPSKDTKALCRKHRNQLHHGNIDGPDVGSAQTETGFVCSGARRRSKDERSPWAVFERLQRKAESEAVAGTGRSIRLLLDRDKICEECVRDELKEKAASVRSASLLHSPINTVCRVLSAPVESSNPASPAPNESLHTNLEVAEALYEDDTSTFSPAENIMEHVEQSQTDGALRMHQACTPIAPFDPQGGSMTPDLQSISQTLDAIILSHRKALDEVTQSLSLELGLLAGEVDGRV